MELFDIMMVMNFLSQHKLGLSPWFLVNYYSFLTKVSPIAIFILLIRFDENEFYYAGISNKMS